MQTPRALIYLALVAALGLSLLPLGPATHGSGATLFFAGTNYIVTGRFRDVWLGTHTYSEGIAINGLPISDVHDELNPDDGKTYQVQWFERARFELHPGANPPNDVLLGLLGKDAVWATRRGEQPFQPVPQPPGVGPDLAWASSTHHTIRGPFLQFWTKYGGEAQFGSPLSEPFNETLEGKPYLVQYFERSRFELHPGLAPEYGGVILGTLGTQQYQVRFGTPIPPH